MQSNKPSTIALAVSASIMLIYSLPSNATTDEKPYKYAVLANHVECYPGSDLSKQHFDCNLAKGLGTYFTQSYPLGHFGFTLNAYFENLPKAKGEGGKEFSRSSHTVRCFLNPPDPIAQKHLPAIWAIEIPDSYNRPETIIAYASQMDSPNPHDPSHWTALEGGIAKSVKTEGSIDAHIPWYLPREWKSAKWVKIQDAGSRLQLTGYAGWDQTGVKFAQLCDEHLSKSGVIGSKFASRTLEGIVQ